MGLTWPLGEKENNVFMEIVFIPVQYISILLLLVKRMVMTNSIVKCYILLYLQDAFQHLRGDCSHWFLTHFHMDRKLKLVLSFSLLHFSLRQSLLSIK